MSANKKNPNIGYNKIINSIDGDFVIYEKVKQVPISLYPSYLQYGIIIFCIQGSAKISVHSNEHLLVKNEMVILFQGQLVSMTDVSKDFLANVFTISPALFNDILSGIWRFSPHFFVYMQKYFYYEVVENRIKSYYCFFEMLREKAESPSNLYPRESIIHILRILYLELYNSYKIKSLPQISPIDSHQREIADKFFKLIMEYYKENQQVAFYAEMLCITPKYLSSVVKRISGKSAKDWILEYVILEIKALLRESSLNIQEIVQRTNFTNQSSLARFFRKHTGMSPSEYRKK